MIKISKPIDILLVEDSPSDADLALEALKDHRVKNCVHWVRDGEEALSYLFKRDNWSNAITPDLIFLDINLPKKNGREVLAEIKSSEDLMHIPVVIMTTSSAEQDISASYALQASSYVIKPLNFGQFLDVMQKLGDYWFEVVRLPKTN